MHKEVLFAVIFGIILGGIILYGINLANNSVRDISITDSSSSAQNTTPTPTPTIKKSFDVLLPENHSVITEKTTLLKGIAKPLSTVAVITEANDLILDVSPEGTFSAQINLIAGTNKIKVIQADKNSTTNSISILVIQQDTIPE
jgi:hypothetical protein